MHVSVKSLTTGWIDTHGD